jgi:hypothetical protein
MKALSESGTLTRHEWHPDWNYSLKPPPKLSVLIIGKP